MGYGEFSKKVLRLKVLPKIVIYESAHVTSLENVFPFKAKPEHPISSFLTDEQQQLLDFGGDGAEAIVPSRGCGRSRGGGARSQRSRNPSARALENTPDVDMLPDLQLTEARARYVHFAATMEANFDYVDPANFEDDGQFDEIFPEVWAVIGSAGEERNYYKLITESPYEQLWLTVMCEEY